MDSQRQPVNVRAFLPHRPPFLFADNATVEELLARIQTTHTFLPDEPYFDGHFPGDPIVPGVVLIEGMAQACRLLLNIRSGRIVPGFLVGLETAKFLAIVRPHDTVSFDCRLERHCGEVYTFRCGAFVGDVRCARGHLSLYQNKVDHENT